MLRVRPRSEPARLLDDRDRAAALAICDIDPVANVFVASRIRALGLDPGRLGAQTTCFRLGDDPGLARFIDSMARRVDGRVVAPELDDLGAAVVGSYLGSRSGSSASYAEEFGGWREEE